MEPIFKACYLDLLKKTWTLINNYSVIVAYFGCHGTNDQRGEFLHLLGKNIRTPRLAKISTIIQKNADLHENLKGKV